MTFLLLLAVLVALMYLGLPIFAALFLLPLGVLWATQGTIATLGEMVFGQLDAYLLIAIPLFMLMAHVMVRSRVVDDLYAAAFAAFHRLRGGIAVATVVACTIFAAISGSSVATALTVGKIAIPQMLRYGISRKGAFGVVAGGGTLGILIPPSAPMILYGYVTETSVPKLFAAGLFPGLMMAAIFAVYVVATEGRTVIPAAAPGAPPAEPPRLWPALRQAGWGLTLPPFVLGGIYLGVFTATEAAGTGALYALAIALLAYRGVALRALWDGVQEATRTSAVLFMIIVGAAIYGYMLTKLRIPQQLVSDVVALGLGRIGFVVVMMVLLFVLGLILESFSIILITMPAVQPVMAELGIDPIWYGVLLTLNLEMALISPPVAMNLMVIKSITGAPMREVNASAWPYMAMLALGTAILIAFPEIALWLPRQMG